MAKYTVRYEIREHYEKTYEADSFDWARTYFYADYGLFDGTPYDSDMELIEIVDEDGTYE